MDIAALSMAMSTSSVQQAASLSMMKKTMDTQEQSVQMMLQGMPTAQPPSTGRLDVRA